MVSICLLFRKEEQTGEGFKKTFECSAVPSRKAELETIPTE
jgi:hypothetical protein